MFSIVSLAIIICTLLQPSSIEGVKILQRRDWLKETEIDSRESDTANHSHKINVQVVNRAKSGFSFPEFDSSSSQSEEEEKDVSVSFSDVHIDVNIYPNIRGKDRHSSHAKDDDSKNNEQISKIMLSPNDINSLAADPPPHDQVAKMARFIVRESNWTSMATISARAPISGFPFANVFSVSDGPQGQSTGIPYMYLTPLEMSVIDLKADNRASLTMSLAQSDYCIRKGYDPEDPRCAHVILTGQMEKISNSSSEYAFAKEALFTRHPEMTQWPQDHGWFFGKLKVTNILLLDYFGGAIPVSVKDYFYEN